MEIFQKNILRGVGGLLGVCGMMGLMGGCAFLPINKKPAPLPETSWRTMMGQVRYMDAKRSFVGDVTIRVDASAAKPTENYAMEVTKAGARLLKLDRQADSGWARGVAAGLPYTGKVESAPGHLRKWYAATSATIALKLMGKNAAPYSENGTTMDFRLEP